MCSLASAFLLFCLLLLFLHSNEHLMLLQEQPIMLMTKHKNRLEKYLLIIYPWTMTNGIKGNDSKKFIGKKCSVFHSSNNWRVISPFFYRNFDPLISKCLAKTFIYPGIILFLKSYLSDFPGGTVVGKPPAKAGDTDSIPGPGRSPMPQSH